eukprot:4442070-Lingulodinium_polyedra.AAC.1
MALLATLAAVCGLDELRQRLACRPSPVLPRGSAPAGASELLALEARSVPRWPAPVQLRLELLVLLPSLGPVDHGCEGLGGLLL